MAAGFAEYAKDNIGVEEAAVAIHWNRIIVNGKNLMPKLPVHIRTHREIFDRNQRIRGMEDKTKCVRKQLSRINDITYHSARHTHKPTVEDSNVSALTPLPQANQEVAAMFGPIPLPPAFTYPVQWALHSAPFSRIHNSTIGEDPVQLKRRRRGRSDKGKPRQ